MTARRFSCALLAAAALATAASAQTTGGLRCRVVAVEDRAPIAGATVTLSSEGMLVAKTARATGKDGTAEFPVLGVGGGYAMVVSAPGFVTLRIADLRVTARVVSEIRVAMTPEQRETVIVEAERLPVDLAASQTATRFSDDFINDLPVEGRYYQNVLTLAPGVQDPDRDGNPNVNGARDRDFKASVSGISNQDPLTGRFMSYVNPDSIEEIEVITAGAGAEYGRAQGGFANIIQKQGSNEFEGTVSALYSSSRVNASAAAGIPDELRPAFQQFQPAFSVSGPIARDKLWYRLSHQYLDREIPAVFTGSVEVSRYTQWIHSDQLTWQATPRNKLALLFQSAPSRFTNEGVSALVPAEATRTTETRAPTFSLTWTAPASPNLLVESQVAYQDSHAEVAPTTQGVPNDCVADQGFLSLAQCFDISSGEVSGSSGAFYQDHRQRLTVRSQATWFKGRSWGMSHQIRAGFIAENERFFEDSVENPTISFSSRVQDLGARPGQPPQFRVVGTAFVDLRLPSSVKYTATGTNWGLYAEDEIRVLSNLIVTLGARLDWQAIDSIGYAPFDPRREFGQLGAQDDRYRAFTSPSDLLDVKSWLHEITGDDFVYGGRYESETPYVKERRLENIAVRNTNVAPRIAVAWDPRGDGRTKLAATWGRYYGSYYLLIPAYEVAPYRATITRDLVLNERTGQWSLISPGRLFNGLLSAYQVDRDLRTPYQDEWTLSFEREIAVETTVRLTYISRRFEDQLQLRNINGQPGDFGRCLPFAEYPVIPSPGVSVVPPNPSVPGASTDWILDPLTGELYPDTDPGPGDGRIDDCQGTLAFAGPNERNPLPAPSDTFRSLPDGIPDLYLQNPLWGGVWRIGNFNRSRYDALQVELVRRQYRNWQMEASYVFSRADGEAEDFTLGQGSDPTTIDQEQGPLGYDQRHVFKANATVLTRRSVRLGAALQWASGLPYSVLRREPSLWAVPPTFNDLGIPAPEVRTRYPTRQRNDQRNIAYWNVDLRVQKDFRLAGKTDLGLTAAVYNLLNDQTYRVFNRSLQSGRQINGTNEDERLEGRRFEVGFRLAF